MADEVSNMQSSDSQKLNPRPHRGKIGKLVLGFFIVLIIGAMAGLGFLIYKKHQSAVGKVGSHVVYQADVDAVVKATEHAGLAKPSQSQARDLVLTRWLYEAMAKDIGIKVTNQEALDWLKQQFVGQQTPTTNLNLTANDAFTINLARKNLLEQKISQAINGNRSGRFIIAHFDQNFIAQGSASISKEQAKLTPGQLQQRQTDDKKYATDFTNNLVAKIKANTTSFDDAIKLELSDPRLGKTPLPSIIQSGVFNSTTQDPSQSAIDQLFRDQTVKSKIANLKAGEVSDPFVVQVATSLDPKNPQKVDGFWLVVRVDQVQSYKSLSFNNLDEAVQYYKKKLNYVTY